MPYPTEHLAIYEPQNPSIDEFHVVRKRQSTDFEDLNLSNASPRCPLVLDIFLSRVFLAGVVDFFSGKQRALKKLPMVTIFTSLFVSTVCFARIQMGKTRGGRCGGAMLIFVIPPYPHVESIPIGKVSPASLQIRPPCPRNKRTTIHLA